MKTSRRDMEAFANMLRKYRDRMPVVVFECMCEDVAWIVGKDNGRFDKARFLSACGCRDIEDGGIHKIVG